MTYIICPISRTPFGPLTLYQILLVHDSILTRASVDVAKPCFASQHTIYVFTYIPSHVTPGVDVADLVARAHEVNKAHGPLFQSLVRI